VSETLSYGLTPGGFNRMRLPEIRRSIFDDLRARIGQPFDETPDSLSGQFVSVFAEREAALWELSEAVYLSAYPATAQGLALDFAVSYAGVTRIQPTPSTARVLLFGTQGTTVEIGSVIESTYLAEGEAVPARFVTTSDTVITRDRAANVLFNVPATVNEGTVYSVTYNGTAVSYTAAAGNSATFVATNLANQLAGLGATVSTGGAAFRIVSNTSFAVTWSDTLTVAALASPALVSVDEDGPIAAPAGSLTRIITPTPGWSAVQQPQDATLGTNLETDEELRDRYATGVYRLGAGTMPSIRANLLQDIVGLTSLAVYENTTDSTDGDGRPPHSVEAVIEGGDDAAIAAAIYRLKPAGIASYGTTSRPYVDETGYTHTIRFSRPADQLVWLKATLVTSSEETVPGDVAARAAAAMVQAGNALGVGEDVLLQRIAAAVFAATSGVARVSLTAVVSVSAPAAGAYSSNDITIGPRQRARFALTRTQVS
jgi:uncharacterized phage protein gp47/JayE